VNILKMPCFFRILALLKKVFVMKKTIWFASIIVATAFSSCGDQPKEETKPEVPVVKDSAAYAPSVEEEKNHTQVKGEAIVFYHLSAAELKGKDKATQEADKAFVDLANKMMENSTIGIPMYITDKKTVSIDVSQTRMLLFDKTERVEAQGVVFYKHNAGPFWHTNVTSEEAIVNAMKSYFTATN
jgi:hypothetical protein